MPRTIVLAPDHDPERSVGWLGTAWMEFFVRHGPGDVQGQPRQHGDEYTEFIVNCYGLDEGSRLLYDSGFFSRPKGSDKSGLGASLGLFEAFGPCRFWKWARGGEVYEDHWGLGFRYVYQPGEPMGRPVQSPFIRCMATEVGQTGNVYQTIYFNLTDDDCPLFYVPGVDPGREKVLLPGGGEINVSTASASSKDGGKETFVVFDETHLYTTPELRSMYRTVTRNLRKRKRIAGTWFLETTTMFQPGEESVAEATYGEAEAIREGRKKRGRARTMFDHRWGECRDLTDEAALRAAIVEAYGEAIGWNDLDGIVDEFYDTRSDPAASRRFFLNAKTSASDAWIAEHEWAACKRPDRSLKRGELVALGLDGSLVDDATAVVATAISDGHQELIGVWERPEDAGDEWQVDREAVDATVSWAMRHFEVVAFFADPPHYGDYIAKWSNEYGAKMQAFGQSKAKPLEWWTNRPTQMVQALQDYLEAVREQRVSYTPPRQRTEALEGEGVPDLAVTFTRHVLNARRNPTRAGLQIRKETSSKKIDGCMAAVLSWTARNAAIAKGVKSKSAMQYVPKRIR